MGRKGAGSRFSRLAKRQSETTATLLLLHNVVQAALFSNFLGLRPLAVSCSVPGIPAFSPFCIPSTALEEFMNILSFRSFRNGTRSDKSLVLVSLSIPADLNVERMRPT